jgi:sugar fermentation stimulation protein A
MNFTPELKQGQFLKRYKRFFADLIDENGETVTAHVPNTGSMKGLLIEGSPCLYSFVDDPKRKLKYTLQMLKPENHWVGINTQLPNKLAFEAFENQALKHWQKYCYAQPEFKISRKTRIDLLLSQTAPEKKKFVTADMDSHQFHFVEIKNVTLAENTKNGKKCALFPDAVTERGQKHLTELIELVAQGHGAEIFFLVQREDCDDFSPATEIDPKYAQLLAEAKAAGVKLSAYQCAVSEKKIGLTEAGRLKIKL